MEVGWCRSRPTTVREEPRMNAHSRARTCPASRALLVRRIHEEGWEPAEAAGASGVGWEYVHVAIDDASRVTYAEVLRDERGTTSCGFLRRAVAYFARLGVRVERVMTDNGSAYRSRRHAHQCARLKLKHLRTRPYRPRTNGKAERMIQTLLREWAYALPYPNSNKRARALKPWLAYYNRQRPHTALAQRPPFTRLPSPV